MAVLYRRIGQHSSIPHIPGRDTALVNEAETRGRCNYGYAFLHDVHKGIVGTVLSNGRELWKCKMCKLPISANPKEFQRFSSRSRSYTAPILHLGYFRIQRIGDTFMDTHRLEKGIVFVNGTNLDQLWHIAPQQPLCLPRCSLKIKA